MTKNSIVVSIARATSFRQADVKKIVQMTLDGIIGALAMEKRIELRNFGVFAVKRRKARKRRNPRTGEAVMVPEKSVVTFKSGRLMQETIHKYCP